MVFNAAPLDRVARIISTSVTLFIIALALFFIIKVPYGLLFALGMMLIPACCYGLKPRYYQIKGPHLIIKKMIGTRITLPLNDVVGYMTIPDLFKLKISRTFGNGGLFGYYGMFSTAEYGPLNCQLTSVKNVIIVKTSKDTYVLSPAEPIRFKEHFRTIVKGQIGIEQELATLPQQDVTWTSPAILALPVMLYLLVVIIIVVSYSHLPERIAVHFDMYGNPDRWGPRTSYLVSSLIPSTILLLVAIAAFFVVRKTTHNPRLPTFLMIIICFIQIFSAYITFNTYWLNTRGNHIMPLEYSIVAFVVILVVLFVYYYKRVVREKS